MAAGKHSLGRWTIDEGYVSAAMRGGGANRMGRGSKNAMVTGLRLVRAFRGVDLQVGKVGSRISFVTDESFAGLGTVAVNGTGSVFKVRGVLFAIGAGQVNYDGAALAGFVASQVLSYIQKQAGVWDPSVILQAGHAQPSPPTIYAKDNPSSGHSPMSAVVSLVCWRVCSITGGVSLMSLPSNVLTLTEQSVIVQVPIVDSNGQDIWGFGAPKIGFSADLGNYYEVPTSAGGEVTEASLGYTRDLGSTDSIVRGMTDASNATPIVITDNGHPFVTGDTVAISGVVGNLAANGTWVITVIDANTYSLDGSVGTGGWVSGGAVGTNIVQAADGEFDSADVGRLLTVGAFESYVITIDSDTQVRVNDINTTGATITDDGTVQQAIDGITRAVEISWSNGTLFGQAFAPDRAFPPVPADFAGVISDVIFLDADGIIYVGDPNTTGSFPPKNALFASARAVRYVWAEEKVVVRFMPNAIGALYYGGGSPALRYYEFRKHQGLKYPQNAGNGFEGRVCAWLGRPTIIGDNLEADFSYADQVMPEFDGWNEEQTADRPIVFGYDGISQYECWCLGKMVMAKLGSTGAWCAPTDLTDEIPGDIVDAVTVGHALWLSVIDGADLKLYQYDAGTGSVMIIQTDDYTSAGSFDTVTEVRVRARVDNNANPVVVEIINTFDDADPYPDPLDGLPTQTPSITTATQMLATRRPNVMDAEAHAVKVTMTSTGGDAGVDLIETSGSTSDVVI